MKRKILLPVLAILSLLLLLCAVSCDNDEQDPTPHTHSYNEWENIKEPTCIQAGEKSKKCTCGDIVKEEIAALGHTEEVLNALAPTCTETGLTEGKKCSVCQEILAKQEVVDALGHTEETLEALAPTCTNTGLTEGKKCSVCQEILAKQEVVDALGHTEETLEALAPTCTNTGLTEGKKCSVCQEILVKQEVVDATGHTYGEWETTKEPTCTEAGEKEQKCACGDVVTDDIDATGHTYGEWETTKAPTCTENGEKEQRCHCGDIVKETVTALGHTEEVINAVAPTCTEAGLKEGKKCSVCEKILLAQTTVDALGHTIEKNSTACATCKTNLGGKHASTGLLYVILDGRAIIVGIDRKIDSSIIAGIKFPTHIDGAPVEEIASYAFEDFGTAFTKTSYANMSSSYVTFYLPTTVKKVGDYAFDTCNGIKISLYDPDKIPADHVAWDKTVTWGEGTISARDCIWGFRPAIGWTRYSKADIPDDYE